MSSAGSASEARRIRSERSMPVETTNTRMLIRYTVMKLSQMMLQAFPTSFAPERTSAYTNRTNCVVKARK